MAAPIAVPAAPNPFPGLRSFESDEEHLFFGRESDTDALLARLRASRFLAVIGTSGSGKSSLVRSGLIPALEGGFMAGAGSSWRIAVLRPGEDPLAALAEALSPPHVLGHAGDLADTSRVLIDATLRRGTRGLVNAVKQAGLPGDHNLLVLVDQFEELFRFRRRRATSARDDAIAFVRLLLEAAAQHALPIYVVVTMRSDFVGDCMDFPGLPEAVNEGLYLVGRMTREQLRSAITGPVAVAGARITPRLVNRVLNDLGDDQDQLPRMQHALMRTWEHWSADRQGPIDVADYEAIGAFADALSRHADEVYREAVEAVDAECVERVFKALTDTHSDPRGVRRPTTVRELAEVSGRTEADVCRVAEIFRAPSRSFLTPPVRIPLAAGAVIDISHESLMRCWTRLIAWAAEEAEAAAFYLRLSQAAMWYGEGKAGLWRPPELRLGERWRDQTNPTKAWAERFDDRFGQAMAFLDHSLREHRRQVEEAERQRLVTLRRTQWTAAVLATLLLMAIGLAVVARRENARAVANLALAREAVDESLSSVDLDPARLGADVPALEELRRDLLAKAQRFYAAFGEQEPGSEQARHDMALAHLRLGHISRLLHQPDEAVRHYRDAIAEFERLASNPRATAAHRDSLADAYNWLGETFRAQPGRFAEAEAAYARALEIQRALVAAAPDNVSYVRRLARTAYNRGILLAGAPDSSARAEADFREAIRLLEPQGATDPSSAQELARAYNNLAGLMIIGGDRHDDARTMYERAIAVDERLVEGRPGNREYKLELAKFHNNLAALLLEAGRAADAADHSERAIALIDELARLAPSLAVEQADAHTLHGAILRGQRPADALREYAAALGRFEQARSDPALRSLPEFHLRFGDLLLDLAAFSADPASGDEVAGLLARGVRAYAAVATAAATGTETERRSAAEAISRLVAELPPAVAAPLRQVGR